MLPAWLTESSAYDPPSDRDGFLRKNVLVLASALVKLRAGAASSDKLSVLDRVLAQVWPGMRLAALLVLVACVSLARNMAFVWLMLAVWLVMLALRPARRIRAVFVPALVAALIALVINMPALLLGQMSAPVRMATKTLVTVGLAGGVAQALGAEGILAALRSWHLPASLILTLDLAFRDIVQLEESALHLSEALALRSVGKDRTKTSSAAGVMGVTFLQAHVRATARAEAMQLRGYGADSRALPAVRSQQGRARSNALLATFMYVVAIVGLAALFAYLEGALA